MRGDRLAAMPADTLPPLSPAARWLGYAGLLPQALALVLYAFDGELRWIVPAAGLFYAALIFSFIGGAWWGAALASGRDRPWIVMVAVLPSLIGWAALLPWLWGWAWPRGYLIGLGVVLCLSPLVDRRLAGIVPMPAGWLRLRVHLSLGLGLMTMALGLLARL